ncbi:MAG TPA: hypothetical protein VJ386_05320 [Candidatus Deferrimicrobiaceae bacterium]|nr:hypothetical protein [Candidatus Deferrimicrobiaceae bacterium]
MFAEETAGALKNTDMWVAPFGGPSVRLNTEILPLEADAELPEGAEADSDPRVAVTVYRSSPSAQTSMKEPSFSRDMRAFMDPKGGRMAWKCSSASRSFPAAAAIIRLLPREPVARVLSPSSNRLVPSWGPGMAPRLRLIATGTLPAKKRRSDTAD